jgi:RNA polymerase sigma factor FliA
MSDASGPAAPASEDTLVRENLALVDYAVAEVANRIPRHVNRDDLVSAAMVGLAQAARSFDPDRGIRFDRYASTRIKGALLDELRRCDWATRSVRAKARKVNAATESLTGRLGRTPTPSEVAAELGCDVADIDNVAADVHRGLVLNYDSMVSQGDGEDMLPTDNHTPDAVLLDRERQTYLVDAVASLPDRLRTVVIGYFFEERPMQDLADELGVSESRISQMRAEALVLLRDGLNSQLDPELVADEREGAVRVAKRKAAYYEAIAQRHSARGRCEAVGLASITG